MTVYFPDPIPARPCFWATGRLLCFVTRGYMAKPGQHETTAPLLLKLAVRLGEQRQQPVVRMAAVAVETAVETAPHFPEELLEGWAKLADPPTEKAYFHNADTNETWPIRGAFVCCSCYVYLPTLLNCYIVSFSCLRCFCGVMRLLCCFWACQLCPIRFVGGSGSCRWQQAASLLP